MSKSEDSWIQEEIEYICMQCISKWRRRCSQRIVSSARYYFGCKICKEFFDVILECRYRKHDHSNQWPYRSLECKMGFSNPSDVHRHMKTHKEDFDCSDCHSRFKNKQNLDVHKLQHSGKYKWYCKICSKGFPFKSKLEKHMFAHKEERNFKCNDCDKTFKYKGDLVNHCKIHNSEKYRFKCEWCSKELATKLKFENHIQHCRPRIDIALRDRENKWKCVACCKQFVSEHERESHTCFNLKGKGFERNELLSNSERKTVSDYFNPKQNTHSAFECDLCNFTCDSSLYLTRHKELNHRL
ncbi:zinc finger protein 229 [Trichonephila clavipes]|nr:zinc finger protein 229 [Trichonephila clavipes]